MSAGSGVVHSEINPSYDVDGHFLQIWIMTRKKGIAPAHSHGVFPAADQLNTFVTLVRPDTEAGAGLPIHQDAYISRGRFMEGMEAIYKIKREGNGVFIFLISGAIKVENQTLEARDALAVSEADVINIIPTSDEPADILIIEVPML